MPPFGSQATGPPLLALDTSTSSARVAVLAPDGACLAATEQAARRHAANLLGLCDAAMRAAGVAVSDLWAIACGRGPGSFTGLRVGLAVGKGLALPAGLKLVMVSSLEALARDLAVEARSGSLLVPCLDAGKGEVHAQLFRVASDGPAPAGGELRLTPTALLRLLGEAARQEDVRAGGAGVDRYAEEFLAALGTSAVRGNLAGPSATWIGRLALARLRRGESDDLDGAVPSYGRPPDITRSKATPKTPGRPR